MTSNNARIKNTYPLVEKVRGRKLQNLNSGREDQKESGRRQRCKSKSPESALEDRLKAQAMSPNISTTTRDPFMELSGWSSQKIVTDIAGAYYTLDSLDSADSDGHDTFFEETKSGASGPSHEGHTLKAPATVVADGQILDMTAFEEIERRVMNHFPNGVHFFRKNDDEPQKAPSRKLSAKTMLTEILASTSNPSSLDGSYGTLANNDDELQPPEQPPQYRRTRRNSTSRHPQSTFTSSADSSISDSKTLVNVNSGSNGIQNSPLRLNRFDASRSYSRSQIQSSTSEIVLIPIESNTEKWVLPEDRKRQPLSPVSDLICMQWMDEDMIFDFDPDLPNNEEVAAVVEEPVQQERVVQVVEEAQKNKGIRVEEKAQVDEKARVDEQVDEVQAEEEVQESDEVHLHALCRVNPDETTSDSDGIDILCSQYWYFKSCNEHYPLVPSYLNPIRGNTNCEVWLELNETTWPSDRYNTYLRWNSLEIINKNLIENAPPENSPSATHP